jgi:hypothetical protein
MRRMLGESSLAGAEVGRPKASNPEISRCISKDIHINYYLPAGSVTERVPANQLISQSGVVYGYYKYLSSAIE